MKSFPDGVANAVVAHGDHLEAPLGGLWPVSLAHAQSLSATQEEEYLCTLESHCKKCNEAIYVLSFCKATGQRFHAHVWHADSPRFYPWHFQQKVLGWKAV